MAEVIVFWAFMCAKEGYNSFHEILLEGGQNGGFKGGLCWEGIPNQKKSSCCYHLQPQNGLNLSLEIYMTDDHLEKKTPSNPPCHLDPSKNGILEGGQ